MQQNKRPSKHTKQTQRKAKQTHKIKGHANTQRLPEEKLISDKTPFFFVGVDYFGPFLVKHGRSELKRYGVLYTCLITKAAHIEVAHSLNTSSYIQSLRRFWARKGKSKSSVSTTDLIS